MADIIQIRRGTASNWTSANPTLADGEQGLEKDTGKIKFGDGVTPWNSLPYYGSAITYTEATERESNTVLFDGDYVIGNAAARTGNILFDFTGAKLGATTEMKHQDGASFTFPSQSVLMFDSADISTTDPNYFMFVLTKKTSGSEVVKVFHAIEGGI